MYIGLVVSSLSEDCGLNCWSFDAHVVTFCDMGALLLEGVTFVSLTFIQELFSVLLCLNDICSNVCVCLCMSMCVLVCMFMLVCQHV